MSPVTYEWHLHPAIHKKYYMIFFSRRAEKAIRKDPGCLVEEWTAENALQACMRNGPKCDQLAPQPEMFQEIKPSKLCPSLTSVPRNLNGYKDVMPAWKK